MKIANFRATCNYKKCAMFDMSGNVATRLVSKYTSQFLSLHVALIAIIAC